MEQTGGGGRRGGGEQCNAESVFCVSRSTSFKLRSKQNL